MCRVVFNVQGPKLHVVNTRLKCFLGLFKERGGYICELITVEPGRAIFVLAVTHQGV